jgi:hypothetical protein
MKLAWTYSRGDMYAKTIWASSEWMHYSSGGHPPNCRKPNDTLYRRITTLVETGRYSLYAIQMDWNFGGHPPNHNQRNGGNEAI